MSGSSGKVKITFGGNRYLGQVSGSQPRGIGTYAGSAIAGGWCHRAPSPARDLAVPWLASTQMGDSAVITGLTAAIVAATVYRSQNQEHTTAPGLSRVKDGPYRVPLARQVSYRAVAAPAYRPCPRLAGRPMIRFIMGGCR